MRFSLANTLLCLTCVCLATAWYVDHFAKESVIGTWRLPVDQLAPKVQLPTRVVEVSFLRDGSLKVIQGCTAGETVEFLGTWAEDRDNFIRCHIVSARQLAGSNPSHQPDCPTDFHFRFVTMKSGDLLLLESAGLDSYSGLDSTPTQSWLDNLDPSNIRTGVYIRHTGR